MQQSAFTVNTFYYTTGVTIMADVRMPPSIPEKDEKGRYGSFSLRGYWSTHGVGATFRNNSEKKTSGQWKEFFTFQERLITEYNVVVQSCFEHGYETQSSEEIDAGLRRAILLVHDQGFYAQNRIFEAIRIEKERVQRNAEALAAQKASPGTHFNVLPEAAPDNSLLKLTESGYEIHRCILSDLLHNSGFAKTDPGWLKEAIDPVFLARSYYSIGDKSIHIPINKKDINHIPEKERAIFTGARFFELAELAFANRESLSDALFEQNWLYLPSADVHDDHLCSDPFLAMALRCKAVDDGTPWQTEDADLGYKVLDPMFVRALKRQLLGWGFTCIDNRYAPSATTYKQYLETGADLHHRGLDPVAYARVNHLCAESAFENLYQSPIVDLSPDATQKAQKAQHTADSSVDDEADGGEFMVMAH